MRAFGHWVVGPYYDSIGIAEFGDAMLAQYWDSDVQLEALNEERVFVARDGNDIVGLAEFGDYDGEPVLWKLYVDAAHRGLGLGRALVERVIDVLPAGSDSWLIEHAAENTTTGDIYERLGFEVVWVDEVDGPGGTTVWRRRQLHGDPDGS